jgi:hypothetical protein
LNVTTVAAQTPHHKAPIAYYGFLHDTHGIFLQADGVVSFLNSTTQLWEEVDLETLTRWAVLNGRLDIADVQHIMDGDRVRRCSRTVQVA